jgi:hypothetical protein
VSFDSKRAGAFSEFRRYRQVLTGVYLVVAVAGFALIAGSVFKELLFRRPAARAVQAISAEDPSPHELLECHREVLDLLTQLGHETCELLALPPSGSRGELPARWEEFSRAWHGKWDDANSRCRFSELADTNLGIAYDHLAQVHGDLQIMRHKYKDLVVRFDEEQAAELVRMRRALDLSRATFEEEARKAPPARPALDSSPRPTGGPTSPTAPEPARLR